MKVLCVQVNAVKFTVCHLITGLVASCLSISSMCLINSLLLESDDFSVFSVTAAMTIGSLFFNEPFLNTCKKESHQQQTMQTSA